MNKQEPFLYRDFNEALKILKTAITQGSPYALLLGESGTGKTTLLRFLQTKLDRRLFRVHYLSYGRPSPSGLARIVSEALHLPLRRTRAEGIPLLIQTLQNYAARFLLWIDEAHSLRDDTLDELRLLSEADLQGQPLLSVILSALPQLKERLLSPALFPLSRRITTRAKLTGLLREEVSPFLAHLFSQKTLSRISEEALSAIFEQARGIPDLVRSLTEACLNTHPQGKITLELASEVFDRLEIN